MLIDKLKASQVGALKNASSTFLDITEELRKVEKIKKLNQVFTLCIAVALEKKVWSWYGAIAIQPSESENFKDVSAWTSDDLAVADGLIKKYFKGIGGGSNISFFDKTISRIGKRPLKGGEIGEIIEKKEEEKKEVKKEVKKKNAPRKNKKPKKDS